VLSKQNAFEELAPLIQRLLAGRTRRGEAAK